jgi:DNA mismatch repair protein MutS
MDEVGRGTSTYDGLSLARASAIQLATVNKAFTLFATHYFELTELAAQYEGIANVHLDAVEYHDQKQGEQLVFMHAVKEGPANRSFGLQVAALAGLPKRVIEDARAYLSTLESGRATTTPPRASTPAPQLGLFDAPRPSAIEDALRAIEPDTLSPREALDALYRLKKLSS